jgi:hypothetical protein
MKVKALLMATAMVASVAEAASSECLYCRHMDETSGWLETWSYCLHSDMCEKDVWNYINRKCTSGWRRGKEITLEECEPEEIVCEEFKSTVEEFGVYTNKTN